MAVPRVVDPRPDDVQPLVDAAVERFAAEVPDEGPFDRLVGPTVEWVDSLHGAHVVSMMCDGPFSDLGDPATRYPGLLVGSTKASGIGRALTGTKREVIEALRAPGCAEEVIERVVDVISVGQPRQVDVLVTDPPGLRPYEVSLATSVLRAGGAVDPTSPWSLSGRATGVNRQWLTWSFDAGPGGAVFAADEGIYHVEEENHHGWRVVLSPAPRVYVWKEDYDSTTSWDGVLSPAEAAAILINPRNLADLLARPREWVIDSPHRGIHSATERIPDGGVGRGGW